MVKHQVRPSLGSDQSELMDESQIDEATNFTKKKSRTNKGASKVLDALDQPNTALGNPPVDEPVQADSNENDEPPVTGRQRGAKNYTLAELNLLNRCMAIAAPIGPQGVTEAVNLYNRVAKDKGWAERREKALRQKWDKVSTIYIPGFTGSYCYKGPNHEAEIRRG